MSSSGGGYKPLHEEESLRKPQAREETVRERAARQRRERQAELTYTQEDYARWEKIVCVLLQNVTRQRYRPTI